MGFGDLKTSAGVKSLNDFLADKSYIEGYQPSQADVAVIEALSGAPDAGLFHALRWFRQVSSYSAAEKTKFPGTKRNVSEYGKSTNGAGQAAAAAKEDDDVDLFGSDDEEEDAEAAKIREERLKAYNAKKSTKPVLIAKSSILLDIKPWDDETDLGKMEECVRSIQCDGLLWGASKRVPLAYGIFKLQINCVVEDDKVGTDFLEEEICKFEDLVQSVDIAAFNKI